MAKYGSIIYGSTQYGQVNYRVSVVSDHIIKLSSDYNPLIDSSINLYLDLKHLIDNSISLYSTISDQADVDVNIFTNSGILSDIILGLGDPLNTLSDMKTTLYQDSEYLDDLTISLSKLIELHLDTLTVFGLISIMEAIYDMSFKIWTTARINEQDLGYKGFTLLRDTERELIPNITIRRVDIPNRNGCIIVGNNLSERVIQLALALNCDTEEEYNSTKRFLAQLISDDIDLIFDDEPDRHYFCRYSGNVDLQEWIMNGFLTIPLRMADPYIYSDKKVHAGVGELTSDGTESTEVIITINGPVTAPWSIIINSTTLTVNKDLLANESLVIDTDKSTISINDIDSFSYVSGNLPLLESGINDISCTTQNISLEWRDKWLI